MKKKIYKYKIENRGKCSFEEVKFAEELLDKLFSIEKNTFLNISPKMFYALKREEIEENEIGGIEFTIISSPYKGRIEIRETIHGDFNIYYYKRISTKIKFTYNLYKIEREITLDKLLTHFYFILDNEEIYNLPLKKGDICLLSTGYICIIYKYYSNTKIGIIYDELSKDVEEYISKDQIVKKIR